MIIFNEITNVARVPMITFLKWDKNVQISETNYFYLILSSV